MKHRRQPTKEQIEEMNRIFDKVNKEQAEYAAKKLLDDVYSAARHKFRKPAQYPARYNSDNAGDIDE